MGLQLKKLWISLRGSFWFLPALMMLASAGLAVWMVAIDENVQESVLADFPRLAGANADGARSILATVAGSMITVAGVTFSITIVALSLASNQYSPRILRNYMRDRGNQFVLGSFVSVFTYCLLVLRTIRGGKEEFIPALSVLVGIGLGLIAIGCLVFFVHHISTKIQASAILASIYSETVGAIDATFPDASNTKVQEKPPEAGLEQARVIEVNSTQTGYIQEVDFDGLIDWAEEEGVMLEMSAGTGDFVIEGAPFLRIHAPEGKEPRDPATLINCYSIAQYRTVEQDPGFGIRQMVDVALKALSPGINDTTTAITCLHYLGAIVFRLATRHLPPEWCCRGKELKLIARRPCFEWFVGKAFSEIRQHARGNVRIYVTILQTLETAAAPGISVDRRASLWNEAVLTLESAGANVQTDGDRETLNKAFARIASAFQMSSAEHLLKQAPLP